MFVWIFLVSLGVSLPMAASVAMQRGTGCVRVAGQGPARAHAPVLRRWHDASRQAGRQAGGMDRVTGNQTVKSKAETHLVPERMSSPEHGGASGSAALALPVT